MALITRQRRIDSSIDLTPLIDVVFQLLIFLMVSSQFTKPEAVVNLPQGPGKGGVVDATRDKLSLAIQEDGQVLLDGTIVRLEDLGTTIKQRVSQSGITRAEIRCDKKANAGILLEVWETARMHGVESIGYVKKRTPTDE